MKNYAIMSAVALLSCLNLTSCDSSFCISEGTAIATPGGEILVENLHVGDIVVSPDPLTKRWYTGRVTSIRTALRKCLVFSLEDGGALQVTPEHPLWEPASLRFKPAGEFTSFSEVAYSNSKSNDFTAARIVAISDAVTMTRVFDLTIDSKSHTFIANGVIVHNKPPLPDPPPLAVTDLRIELTSDTTALAIWTEPLPQNQILVSAQFLLDTVAVTDSTLDLARLILVDLMESNGGSVDSAMLSGLAPSTNYFVRMRVSRGGEASALSNQVSFTTGP